MTAAEARAFAEAWREAWNSHDLDRILAHYAQDIVFRSRRAEALTGHGTLDGRLALRAYWQEALRRQPALHFEIRAVYAGHETLVIAYFTHSGVEAAETLRFGADGLVVEASACHAE